MSDQNELSRSVYAAFEVEPHINIHEGRIQILGDGTIVTLTGEVNDIAAKRYAVLTAKAVPGVTDVCDELTVSAAEPVGDGAIRNHVQNALLGESAFDFHGIAFMNGRGELETLRSTAPDRVGRLVIGVQDGIVVLDGVVETPSHRRLAEVLAWWAAGTRNVMNRLAVEPPREDSDDEMADAVRLVLEKDPLVTADQITVRAESCRIRLAGTVPRESQKSIAEHDVWYVDGVKGIVNELVFPQAM